MLSLPYVSGAFEWSGFDYKGEPVPNQWPDVNSHFGFLDIAGFLKERGHWQRVWLANPEPPAIHVFPHWNWAAGMTVTVFAFSNVPGGSIELLLNGQVRVRVGVRVRIGVRVGVSVRIGIRVRVRVRVRILKLGLTLVLAA